MTECVFCRIIEGELPAHIVFEDDLVLSFMSLENHPLIVPKRHFRDVYDLDDAHAGAIMQTAVKVANATRAATGCEGMTLSQASGAVAGQDVFHFHLHVKPRFKDDGVVMRWDASTVPDGERRLLSEQIRQNMN